MVPEVGGVEDEGCAFGIFVKVRARIGIDFPVSSSLMRLMKIIIRNLSRDTTEAEVKDLFVAFGEVKSCDLVMDKITGNSKGFGFVEMPNDKHAKNAIKNLNDKTIAGSRIRVKVAEEK